MEITETQFTIGQIIHHRLFDYRGVIIDIDPQFMGSDEWYEQVAKSRPPKDKPWYHVLVDGASHETYVAERHLEDDTAQTPISHPLLGRFFQSFEQGKYQPQRPVN